MAQDKRVLICGGDAMLAHGLNAFIPWASYGVERVLSASASGEALEKFASFAPEIVIVDGAVSGVHGIVLIEAMERIRTGSVFLLMGDAADLEDACARAGLVDLLIKPVAPGVMQFAVARAAALLDDRGALLQALDRSQSMLSKAKSLLIQNLALEIIRGTFEMDKGTLDKRFAELNIRFAYQHYFCFVAAIAVPPDSKIKKSVCFEAIRSRIFERFPIRTDVTVADSLTLHDGVHISIVIGYDREDDIDMMTDFVAMAFRNMEKIFALPYVLVASDATNSINNIRKLHQRAKRICTYLKFTMQYGFYRVSACEQRGAFTFILSQDQRAFITRHLMMGDISGLKRDLGMLRQSALAIPVKDIELLLIAVQEVLAIGAAFLRTQGKSLDSVYAPDIYTRDFFDSFEHIDGLYQWLAQYFETICDLSRDEADEKPGDAAECVKHFVAQHYNRPLSLKSVAQALHYNPNYLGRVFYRCERQKFTEYLHGYRIRQALLLLTDETISIPEVAERVGYQDTSYFFRVFKKRMGMTPSDYRAGKT